LTEAYGFAISKQASQIGKLHNTSRISINFHMEVQFAQEKKGMAKI
jgi:hypothetical protein